MRRRGGDDLADGVQAIGARDECSRRLEAQSGEMRVAGGDIRWIRDDEIEALALEGCEPAAMAPIDFCAECDGVTFRDLERCGARFHGDDAHSRPVLFESECNRAATRAQIEGPGEIPLEREYQEELAI